MSDLTTLARQLVEAGAIRWEAGMMECLNSGRRLGRHGEQQITIGGFGPTIPALEDPATAALLAVQAMERGVEIGPRRVDPDEAACWVWALSVKQCGVCPTLGEAAARALLALEQPTTKETP
jgi:hypothetical protein